MGYATYIPCIKKGKKIFIGIKKPKGRILLLREKLYAVYEP